MTSKTRPVPDGYHTVTPYLTVEGAPQLIEFLTRAFEAQELNRLLRPDGTIANAEVKIGDSRVLVSESRDEWKLKQGTSHLYLYVEDTDATYRRSLQAGALSVMEPEDKFYGDRNAGVQDTCGNYWWIATHIEDVAPEEMQKRLEAATP